MPGIDALCYRFKDFVHVYNSDLMYLMVQIKCSFQLEPIKKQFISSKYRLRTLISILSIFCIQTIYSVFITLMIFENKTFLGRLELRMLSEYPHHE